MNPKIRFLILLLVSVWLGADAGTYSVDLESSERLTDQPPTVPLPSRVEVTLAGPKMGLDKTLTGALLHFSSSPYTLTNSVEISELMAVLSKSNDKERIENMMQIKGYTYHFLLFQDTNQSVMHVRAFQPLNSKTNLCAVMPRSYSSSTYYNNEIGNWLQARAGRRTNDVPSVSETQRKIEQDSTNNVQGQINPVSKANGSVNSIDK